MSLSAAGRTIAALAVASSLAGCPGGHAPSNAGPHAAAELGSISRLADAFKAFHDDTGGWPMGRSAWTPVERGVNGAKGAPNQQIEPAAFSDRDTALFQKPENLKQCSAEAPRPCWNGPYLAGKSLVDAEYLDAWKHPRLFLLARPTDGMGGGTHSAPDGLVAIWSVGPDGRDGFGCSDASCARNWEHLGHGQPSDIAADDVAVVVGTTK